MDNPEAESSYASHAVRLTCRQWAVTACLVVAVMTAVPVAWESIEEFQPGPDYRIPYALSNDYWHYGRLCRRVAGEGKVAVIGDSVVWGEYVKRESTLSGHLCNLSGSDGFANLGLDGTHTAALGGLINYYGGAISDMRVILHFNPLWMSSSKHDLRTKKEFQFNHPRLVPQFTPGIPCYSESTSGRIGVIVERNVTFFAWVSHVREAYFGGKDVPSWTLEHPYDCPTSALTLELPKPSEELRHEAVSWSERGMRVQNFKWVDLDTSFQWGAFRRLVGILRDRGNSVFVVVGPFNEHIMTPASLASYTELKRGVAAWLSGEGVASYIPPALPSELYADASHPLSEGYRILAVQLLDNDEFVRFLGPDPPKEGGVK